MASGHRSRVSRALGFVASIAAPLLLVATAWAAPEKVAGGIRFSYRDPNAGSVSWAGAFNNWAATANPMKKDDKGIWTVVVALPAGEQQYKFVVDGQWFADPENPVTGGEFGNSVVKVGPDGGLVAQAATANTAYSPKITITGRTHSLMEEIFDSSRSRFELTRPTFDIDLGFNIRISDMMTARILTNIDPQKEDVQDYRSRLNWKQGAIEFQQPDLTILGFDSETLSTWTDPAHLVGNVGVYHHPFGHQQDGFLVSTPKYGFDTHVLYSDNSAPGGTTFPATGRDPATWYKQLIAVRAPDNSFGLIPGETVTQTTTDVGDGGGSYGFGDGATNVFAAEVHRDLPHGLRLGLLGRSDRGFHLGYLTKAVASDDSSGYVLDGQTEQQWFAGGGDFSWSPTALVNVHAEYLQGARRLDMMDRGTIRYFHVTSMTSTTAISGPTVSNSSAAPLGQHFDTDESARMIVGGSWTFAQGDVSFGAEYEHQSHRYPSWLQPAIGPPAAADPSAVSTGLQNLNTLDSAPNTIDNGMDELRLNWDRNWRYYLGREVKTSISGEFTSLHYDARTAWQYQMWFPTGNFWLPQDGQVVSFDRLTSTGLNFTHVYRVCPSIVIPIRHARNVVFAWKGTFTGTPPSLGHFKLQQPRYAESIFQLGCDVTDRLRFTNDTRWAKYDAPAQGLMHGYLSQFSELVYRFTSDIHVGVGLGLDPVVLDPVTNEFANIGRETYFGNLNANGYKAETDATGLAGYIAAAEHDLRAMHRIQFEAVVRF